MRSVIKNRQIVEDHWQPVGDEEELPNGAVIVSFLGGIHWGIGLRYAATETPGHAFHLVWGTVPPLLAWVAIMMPAFAGLPLLGLVLVACYAVDRKTWADAGLLQRLTGYRPQTDIRDGIAQFVSWYRDYTGK